MEVDEPLVIPTNKRIRFLITANDVIHSWWVPDFAVKQDAIPGFINTAWTQVDEEGIFRGQCTELCGQYHGYMPVVVKAVSPEDYELWVNEKKEAKFNKRFSLKSFGQQKNLRNWRRCLPNQLRSLSSSQWGRMTSSIPALAGSDLVLNDKAKQIEILMEGVQGAAMQSYAEQLSEVDIAAVITYTRKAG